MPRNAKDAKKNVEKNSYIFGMPISTQRLLDYYKAPFYVYAYSLRSKNESQNEKVSVKLRDEV